MEQHAHLSDAASVDLQNLQQRLQSGMFLVGSMPDTHPGTTSSKREGEMAKHEFCSVSLMLSELMTIDLKLGLVMQFGIAAPARQPQQHSSSAEHIASI